MVNEKKVIAVIVEGPSDEAALGSILKEYFSSAEIQFVVVHGDITTKDYTSTDNIPVSYTHLDVYKRQILLLISFKACVTLLFV